MPLNLPIVLTWLRIAMIPLLVALYYLPAETMPARDALAAGAFIVAAVTDWLDGYLARRWRQTSAFGAFLDPVADKLMVSAALLILLGEGRVDAVIALIIIGREITISALREWMAQVGARSSVAVNWLGKFKTAVQMTAIPCLLYHEHAWGIDFAWWGARLVEVAAVMTDWSMLYYLKQSWPALKARSG